MVHTNKILTVSYGTFSCTLEGFDDAFGTMKAIAEYFRDLAADDRYFGAEPPQPDADMLARIAQREITRRVEAHQDANGVLLRATDMEDAPAAPEAAPVAPIVEAPVDAAPEPMATLAESPVIAEPEAEPADLPHPDSVADTTADAEVADAAPDSSPDSSPVEDAPLLAETAGTIPADWNPDCSSAADLEAPEPDTAEIDLVAPLAPAPVLTPVSDTMADKLARIRAVVERNDAVVDNGPAPEILPSFDDAFEGNVAEPIGSAIEMPRIEDAFDATDEAPEMAQGMGAEDELFEDDSALIDTVLERAETAGTEGEFEANAFVEDPMPPVDVAPIDAATESSDPAYDLNVSLPEVGDRTVIARRPQPPAPLSDAEEEAADNLFGTLAETPEDLLEDENEASDDAVIGNVLSDLEPEEPVTGADPQTGTAPAPKPAARVIKVKRSDLEDAIASGTLEEVTDEAPNSSLSAEDEAELQAELDAVAAELAEAQAALNPPDDAAAEPIAQPEPSAPVRAGGADKIEAARPDLSRLMAKAASKMDEPESSSRRSAYAHLRAAVAAAEAEESLGDGVAQADIDAAYREDLANVVRPRRPDAVEGSDRPSRLGHARPAPLKLVAEQRIDADEVLPQRGPIRPRRIASEAEVEDEAEAGTDHSAGFAIFAKEVGAKDLHELLEAAAAYLSFVEGREQFSRPQLMTRVKQVNERGFNREDGLRTFGQLLREGKIEKTSGGRFTASEQIGFRPARKAAG